MAILQTGRKFIIQRSPFGGSAFCMPEASVDTTGAYVVKYKYDAWSKPLSKTGTLAATLGTLQPFRYRHYAFDEETGMHQGLLSSSEKECIE